MSAKDDFKDIRPYNDSDAPAALNRLAESRTFLRIIKSIYPALNRKKIQALFNEIKTIYGFQTQFARPMIDTILEKSAESLTISGMENLKSDQAYLFISNHRDILLDSTLLNYLFMMNDRDTTQLAIGSNLLLFSWLTDFFKLNKSIIVKRDIPPRELYVYSQRLSAYIKQSITEENTSTWIAQREGRTKDGNDKTQPGLLKMLLMAGDEKYSDLFRALKIVPVSISYEYEPCDGLKVAELQYIAAGKSFRDAFPKIDLLSMLTGMKGKKGNIHFAVGTPLDSEFDNLDHLKNKNEIMRELAKLIDVQIFQNYKLWKNNYIAYDSLNKSKKFQCEYSQSEEKEFMQYLEKTVHRDKGDFDTSIELLLKMYANPVINKFGLTE